MSITRKGIDVSYSQGNIDWEKVKSSGIEFALIRIGWCYNNGILKEDDYFKANISGAIAAGIDVGVYLYSYATTSEAARVAANQVVEAIKPYKLLYPVAFDIEYESIYTNGLKENNTAIATAFLDEIEKAGYYAMLYCSKDFLENYLIPEKLEKYDKWIAQYASSCTCKYAYGIWQYTSNGKVDGINTDVDMNIAYKDYASIIGGKGMGSDEEMENYLPYTVEVGSYVDASLAEVQRKKLADKGYYTFTINVKGEDNRVCVGRFKTDYEAEVTKKDLKNKGFEGYVKTV